MQWFFSVFWEWVLGPLNRENHRDKMEIGKFGNMFKGLNTKTRSLDITNWNYLSEGYLASENYEFLM